LQATTVQITFHYLHETTNNYKSTITQCASITQIHLQPRISKARCGGLKFSLRDNTVYLQRVVIG